MKKYMEYIRSHFIPLIAFLFIITNKAVAQKTYPTNPATSEVLTTPSPESPTSVDTKQYLTAFGLNLFENQGSALDMSGTYILPPDYKLGPGDKMGIYLLGENQTAFEVIINVEGKIFIPSVGVISIWGLKLDEAREILNKKLSKFYDNYTIDMMLLQPKNVQVNIVGEVKKPGKYVVNALSSILDALILAGGPSNEGSLRSIQLLRNDSLFVSVDLYQFLMRGATQNDFYLESGDLIFIPIKRATVTVTGEVERSAIFELKPGAHERLSDVIQLAGNFTELAYLPKIEISRMNSDGSRFLQYIDYEEILISDSCDANIELRNGDNVHVYSKLEQLQQTEVAIYGMVRRPGRYPWQENMHVSDLIIQAGNLTRSAYLLQAEVARIDPLQPAKVIKIKLNEIFNSPHSPEDLVLEEDDKVFIREIPEWLVGPIVEVLGEAMFPGVYPIIKDSTTLSEIIEKAGGFTREALIREAMVIRKSTKITIDKEYERLKEMSPEKMSESEYQYFVMKRNMQDVGQVLVDFFKLFIESDKREDIILEDGDIIQIPKAPIVVQVTGRVSKPGGVLYKEAARLKYYLEKAGGITWDADVKNTKVSKVTGEILDDEDVKDFVPGDIIWVPRKPYRDWWAIFRDSVAVITQLSAVFLIIQNIRNN